MKLITFKEALDQEKVKENDYFLVQYPEGKEVLFRLIKKEDGYVMWGPPTEKKVIFDGKEGYDNLSTLADSRAREEYAHEYAFEDVHACRLPEKQEEFNSYIEFVIKVNKFRKMYEHPDDMEFHYALASRCNILSDLYPGLRMFYVSRGTICTATLYFLNGANGSYSCTVRPEAVPNLMMELLTEEQDGSKKKPWICKVSQSEDSVSQDEVKVSTDKEELMNLIQEVYKWITKLEEYVKNLE